MLRWQQLRTRKEVRVAQVTSPGCRAWGSSLQRTIFTHSLNPSLPSTNLRVPTNRRKLVRAESSAGVGCRDLSRQGIRSRAPRLASEARYLQDRRRDESRGRKYNPPAHDRVDAREV